MLNHSKIQEQLHDYIDGTLSPEETHKVIQHLQACPDCARKLESLQTLKLATDDLADEIAPPQDLWTGIADRLDEVVEPTPLPGDRARQSQRYSLWTVAAVLALAIILPPSLSRFSAPENRTVVDLGDTSSLVINDCRVVLASSDESRPDDANTALDESLTLLEKAIKETQQAMADLSDTSEDFSRLASGYRQKLDLLQRIAIRTATP
jgi:anti-sigma factor RsiW